MTAATKQSKMTQRTAAGRIVRYNLRAGEILALSPEEFFCGDMCASDPSFYASRGELAKELTTLEETGREFGVTREMVRQIEIRGLRKIKSQIVRSLTDAERRAGFTPEDVWGP